VLFLKVAWALILSEPARFLIFFWIVNDPLGPAVVVPRDDDRAVVRDAHRPHLAGAVRVDLVFQFDLAVIVLGLQFEVTTVGAGATGSDAGAAASSRSECRAWPRPRRERS
jgi:hypothetical protein